MKGSEIIRIYSAKSYLDPVLVNAHYSIVGYINGFSVAS
jgi:hypothetical protein